MHNITEYRLEPGSHVDVEARRRIQVAEVVDDRGGARKVLETIRVGFICSPSAGEPTILRKTEVVLTGA